MKTIATLLILIVLAATAWVYWGGGDFSSLQKAMSSKFGSSPKAPSAGPSSKSNDAQFLTLEARYTAESIVKSSVEKLVKDEKYQPQPPTTLFYPFALMEVKYTKSNKTSGEGQILWSLENGEMVINASNWEITHGFEDCIEANATREDFEVINELAKHGNVMDKESLFKALHVESHVFDRWIKSVLAKKLVVPSGNGYRLHFENPKLNVIPETQLKDPIVAKVSQGTSIVEANFTNQDIEKISKAAFGPDFFIRRSKKVYLPVYRIGIKNPDSSVHMTYWNAFTGKVFQVEVF